MSSRYVSTTRSRYVRGCATSNSAGPTPIAEVGAGRARVWRLYMAASAVNFEAGRNQIHQVLAVRDDRESSRFGLRPDWESTPEINNYIDLNNHEPRRGATGPVYEDRVGVDPSVGRSYRPRSRDCEDSEAVGERRTQRARTRIRHATET